MDTVKVNKTLKERMTEIRSATDYRLDNSKDVLIMIDGHNFSKMIKKKFALPFDYRFVSLMNETAQYVAKNLQVCKFAYVQSDEITFYISPNKETDNSLPFGGRLCKLQSIVAGMATKYFNYLMFTKTTLNDLDSKDLVEFDCKAWNVDSINDAFAYFIWRQNDCVRNSKNQVAQAYFSHKELQNKSADEEVEMLLKEKGVDWNAFDEGLKYGRFIYADNIEKIGVDGEPCIRTVWSTHDGFVLDAKEMMSNYNDNDGRFWEKPKKPFKKEPFKVDKLVKFRIDNFNNACNSIADEINRKLFDSSRIWYWIGDEVGGICDFDDTDFLSITDMILLLENNYTYEQYAEWRDANIMNEKRINLSSWIMGARHEMLNNTTNSPC